MLHVCGGLLTVIGTNILHLLLPPPPRPPPPLPVSSPLLFYHRPPLSPQVSGREEARRVCRAGPRAVDEQCLHHAVHVSRARGDSTRQGEGGGSGSSFADAGLLRGDPAVRGDAVTECARVGGDYGLGVYEAEDGGRSHLMQWVVGSDNTALPIHSLVMQYTFYTN